MTSIMIKLLFMTCLIVLVLNKDHKLIIKHCKGKPNRAFEVTEVIVHGDLMPGKKAKI